MLKIVWSINCTQNTGVHIYSNQSQMWLIYFSVKDMLVFPKYFGPNNVGLTQIKDQYSNSSY